MNKVKHNITRRHCSYCGKVERLKDDRTLREILTEDTNCAFCGTRFYEEGEDMESLRKYTVKEIAEEIGVSERMIMLKLQYLGLLWKLTKNTSTSGWVPKGERWLLDEMVAAHLKASFRAPPRRSAPWVFVGGLGMLVAVAALLGIHFGAMPVEEGEKIVASAFLVGVVCIFGCFFRVGWMKH